MEIVMFAKKYWIVRIEYSQTDSETVLVDAPTAAMAENIIRERGCTARYIRAQREQARVVN
jgi:hypothetical protein